jgi:hypothetical protein
MRAIALAIILGCGGIEMAIKKANGVAASDSHPLYPLVMGALALIFFALLVAGI